MAAETGNSIGNVNVTAGLRGSLRDAHGLSLETDTINRRGGGG